MKNFLNYQSTEYDCGPVSMMNGVRYLFDREEIYPDVVKFIHLYCMDQYNSNGELCKSGTSHSVMKFLSHWLNDFRECKHFPIECECLENEEVFLQPESEITAAIREGGCAVLYVHLDVWHYVLLTDIKDDIAYIFDPYYEDEVTCKMDPHYVCPEIEFVFDQPKKYNRKIAISRLNEVSKEVYYSMGPTDNRIAVTIKRK